MPEESIRVGDHYYILASSVGADLPTFTLKQGDAFIVADRRGDFPYLPNGAFGFYVEDTRFLQCLALRIHGDVPVVLNAAVSEETLDLAVELTNPDIRVDGREILPGRTTRLARTLTLKGTRLYETLAVESFAAEPHELNLSWSFASDFVDVFEVRGFVREQRGELLAPRKNGRTVRLAYRGRDDVVRSTELSFSPDPTALDSQSAHYRFTLAPGGRMELGVTVSTRVEGTVPPVHVGDLHRLATGRSHGDDRLSGKSARIETSHTLVNRWIDRAEKDLRMLLTETPEGPVPYAGIPWFVAPFGRDSLITALQTLPFAPEIARGTLRFLARHQGTLNDDFTDQEPGKILHELRRGELAHCREIVFIPYYGTVDATPLFVMLLAEYVRWSGDTALAQELWPAVEGAVTWMGAPETPAGTGYLRYQRRSPRGLENQGWKDAQDAIMHRSGALAEPPIALAEAQGYKHAALSGAADLAEMVGHGDRAPALRNAARQLADRFERDFWMDDEDFYALALDGDDRPCRVITSNPGHCLWTGIVPKARAPAVAKRLLSAEMFSGWGLRTLSAREHRYNPMSYHTGSVWPHDSAIAAVGLCRYGLTEQAVAVATGLFEAVRYFEGLRMPELFCGFSRVSGYGPTRYPVACSPQAWAAGVVFQLLAGVLGLAPDARGNRLSVVQPILPPWLSWVALYGLRVRDSSLDVMVTQGREGAAVELLDRRGDAELVVRK